MKHFPSRDVLVFLSSYIPHRVYYLILISFNETETTKNHDERAETQTYNKEEFVEKI